MASFRSQLHLWVVAQCRLVAYLADQRKDLYPEFVVLPKHGSPGSQLQDLHDLEFRLGSQVLHSTTHLPFLVVAMVQVLRRYGAMKSVLLNWYEKSSPPEIVLTPALWEW